MKALLQRVSRSAVRINGEVKSEIGPGILIFLGVHGSDSQKKADALVKKILALRIFEDAGGKMNRSVLDEEGDILIVSQFTLYADTKKGNRPSFVNSAPPALAEELYNYFVERISDGATGEVKTGIFAADMQVSLVNDGPVTILLEN